MQKEEYLKYMIIFVFTTSNDSFRGFFTSDQCRVYLRCKLLRIEQFIMDVSRIYSKLIWFLCLMAYKPS